MNFEKPETRKNEQEKIEAIEKSSILNSDKKLDLASFTLLEQRKIAYIGDHKIIESEKEEKKLKEEFSKELEELKKVFDTLGVPYEMAKDLKIEDGIIGFNIVAGKAKEDLDKFLEAEKSEDDKTMGLLLGFPKTAVEAYNSEESLNFEKFFSEEMGKKEQKKLEDEGVLKFLSFQPSKKHWREELEEARKLQSLIKEKAPMLYEEIMESESIYTIEYQEKKSRFKEIKNKIDRTVDKKGKSIDEGIKDNIVFLTALGINTTGSCEGHIDHGINAPYIDIESRDILKLDKRLKETKDEKEAEEISKEINRDNLEERKKIINLLDEFYRNRSAPYDARLIINPLARGGSRLESQGVDFQEINPEEVKKEKLAEYQKEMADFTEFLKNKYLEG